MSNGLNVLYKEPVGKTCLENKAACGMVCCKTFALTTVMGLEQAKQSNSEMLGTIPSLQWKVHKKYYEIHGVEKINEFGTHNVMVKVKTDDVTRCKPLQGNAVLVYRVCDMLEEETGKCKLHYRGKPDICKDGYTKQREGVIWFRPCVYQENMPENATCINAREIIGE